MQNLGYTDYPSIDYLFHTIETVMEDNAFPFLKSKITKFILHEQQSEAFASLQTQKLFVR